MGTPYNKRTALAANTYAAVAEATAELALRCHINVLNKGVAATKLRLFIGTSATPSAADYIEYDAYLLPGEPIRNWPIVLLPNQKAYARVEGADCNVVAWGEYDYPLVS